MDHLSAGQRVRLHLLIDKSWCQEDERLTRHLSEQFPNLTIILHDVAERRFDERDFKGSLWSKAACYRLILPELLKDADYCLYLDSDTLVVGNILPLWQLDMTEYCLAGVFDDIAPVRMETVGKSVPGIETYVNSGVLFMNLALMRKMKVQEKLLAGILDYLVVDQDLLNAVCYGSIRLLPQDYNCIPGVRAPSPRILHFLMRDYIRPWKNRRAASSGLWWHYAELFSDIVDLEQLRERADWFQRGSVAWIFRRCADFGRIFIVGSGMDAQRIFRALRLGKCKGLQKVVREDEVIPYSPDTLIIIASGKKQLPGLNSFLAHDYAREQLIRFERRPVSYYNLLPEECRREVYAELLMMEYGVSARGAAVPAALLEMNAVRFPEREAVVEWKDGVRRACSFRELNIMANRMADALKKKGTKRGEGIALPAGANPGIEVVAAMLGIMKAGRVVCNGRHAAQEANLFFLHDGRYSTKAPRAEAVPDEAAFRSDTATYTGRKLCEDAEHLRRKIGWHSGDSLLLTCASGISSRELTELVAAFSYGCVSVIASGVKSSDIIEIAKRESSTIVSVDSRMLRDFAAEDEALTARMLLTEAGDESAELCSMWRERFPEIQVNGQGYEGEFFYDCEWY